MTAYRIEDFEEEEDFDSIELEPEHRAGDAPVSTEVSSSEDSSVLAEVIEPRLAETTRRKAMPVEVTQRTNFKTKCQMMQEESDNGTDCIII